jgi:hypothetical protein
LKRKQFIEIPEPCHEIWSEMEIVSLGRHCMVCEKKVVDFRRMPDQQVIDILHQSNYKTCGRFTENQLLNGFEKEKENYLPFQLKAAASAIFLLFSNKAFTANLSNTAKVEVNSNFNSKEVYRFTKHTRYSPADTNQRYLKGVVVDSITGELIPGVKITLVENSSRTITDIDGKFVLELPNSIIDYFIILVSSIEFGWDDYEIHISREKDNLENYQILLPSDMSDVPMIGIVVPVKKKWWQRKKKK